MDKIFQLCVDTELLQKATVVAGRHNVSLSSVIRTILRHMVYYSKLPDFMMDTKKTRT